MRKRSTKNKREKIGVNQMGEEEIKAAGYHPADTNGDGKVSPDEQSMYLEFRCRCNA
jgi:hypothetical protein